MRIASKFISFLYLLTLHFKFDCTAQQTEMYLGIKEFPSDNANFSIGLNVVPVNDMDYYVIQLFSGNKVDSIQYRRYKEPYTYSNVFDFKFNYPKTSGGNSAVINYMRNDELITHFAITPSYSNNLNQGVRINNALNFNGNLFLAGTLLNCDSIKIVGFQSQFIKTSSPKDTLVPFFLCLKPHEEIVKYAEFASTVCNIDRNNITMLFNAPVSIIAPSISDTIFKDSATTGVLVNFDSFWNVKWFSYGLFPIGLNIQKNTAQLKNLNSFLVAGNSFSKNGSKFLPTGKYNINSKISSILYGNPLPNYTFSPIIELSKNGSFLNNYWVRFTNNSYTGIINFFYYKNGLGFLLNKSDSFEFGKNNVSWGKIKPTKQTNGTLLVIIDTLTKKINYDITPENVTNFAYYNDSSYYVIGETKSSTGYYDFDLSPIGSYKIPAGPYIAKYSNIGKLLWARNDKYGYGLSNNNGFFNSYNATEFIYSLKSPRQDMDYGSKILYKLHNDQYTTWITKLNCKPISDFTINLNAGCVDFSSLGTMGASIKWDFGDGRTEINNLHPSHCYTYNNKFKVKLITSNKCGADTAIKDVLMTRADVNANTSTWNQFSIFPNPSSSNFTLKSNGQNYFYELYALDGKLVFKNRSNQQFQNINLGGFKSGIYILKVGQMNQTYIYKLILQN